jgi:hypothetical protein
MEKINSNQSNNSKMIKTDSFNNKKPRINLKKSQVTLFNQLYQLKFCNSSTIIKTNFYFNKYPKSNIFLIMQSITVLMTCSMPIGHSVNKEDRYFLYFSYLKLNASIAFYKTLYKISNKF